MRFVDHDKLGGVGFASLLCDGSAVNDRRDHYGHSGSGPGGNTEHFRQLTQLCRARNCLDMNVTISLDDELIRKARRQAAALGTSVDQLVREYLESLAGTRDPDAQAAEFERLSRVSRGNSRGWKFNREELHDQ